MDIIVAHPTGNKNVRAVISGFEDNKVLKRFVTTIALNNNTTWLKYLPKSVKNELLRRSFQLNNSAYLKGFPSIEIKRLLFTKIPFLKNRINNRLAVDNLYTQFDAKVVEYLKKTSKVQHIDAVYAYEDGALQTFKYAKSIGIKNIYDLPIAYWEKTRALLADEALRLPNWANTLGGGITDSKEKLQRKTMELQEADVVVVPSKFVLDSLPDWASGKRVIFSPFGSPNAGVEMAFKKTKAHFTKKSPLRVLFAGSMGQRKGLGDLFEAIKLLNTDNVQLVVLGSLLAPMGFYQNILPNFIHEKVRPNHQVLELMRSCDVFCLPSVVEGRALVMQEAMSQGLPLIITPNTGGEDLVIEGNTGFLVPVRSPESIAAAIQKILDSPANLETMGQQAFLHAATYSWQKYSDNIVNALKSII